MPDTNRRDFMTLCAGAAALITGVSLIDGDPGYQSALEAGRRALESGTAKGTLLTGGTFEERYVKPAAQWLADDVDVREHAD